MTTAIIIGHSFISGLQHHFRNQNFGKSMTPEEVAATLEISDRVTRVILSGISGAQICTPYSTLPHHVLRIERPDLAILQIGTNDLAAGRDLAWVAREVISEAKTLIEIYDLQHVTVCSALFRESGIPAGCDFRQIVQDFNDDLYFTCFGQPDIAFHSHDGFWTTPVSVWSRDGIHPNSFHGWQIYKKSVRQALFHGLSSVFSPLQ